mmetsp:Transcript_67870/g.113750  ORF Transcript_67870/g.113750 Transcript_67870/m.113750 type:complete len:209 (-) Transcript_67870:115-741(-)
MYPAARLSSFWHWLSLRTFSVPSSTRPVHVRQTPFRHKYGISMPASSQAMSMDWSPLILTVFSSPSQTTCISNSSSGFPGPGKSKSSAAAIAQMLPICTMLWAEGCSLADSLLHIATSATAMTLPRPTMLATHAGPAGCWMGSSSPAMSSRGYASWGATSAKDLGAAALICATGLACMAGPVRTICWGLTWTACICHKSCVPEAGAIR